MAAAGLIPRVRASSGHCFCADGAALSPSHPVGRPSDQPNRLSSLVCYVHGSLGRRARLCPSQQCDPPRTACESVPPVACGPPLPGWPSYSPLSRANMSHAKLSEVFCCWTERKATHAPPVHRTGLDLFLAGLRSRPAGSHRSEAPLPAPSGEGPCTSGDRGRARTCNPQLRRLMLYPVELRGRTPELQSLVSIVMAKLARRRSEIAMI